MSFVSEFDGDSQVRVHNRRCHIPVNDMGVLSEGVRSKYFIKF